MQKTSFLIKLKEEGKLEFVEPSDEIKQSYIQKSESYLISARILLKNNRLEESVSLAYYSMYHILTSLLFRVGIKCENHTASIMLLKLVFGIENSSISLAKHERVDKQYYVGSSATRVEVEELIKNAEKFHKKIYDFILKINNKDIQDYRKKLKEIIDK